LTDPPDRAVLTSTNVISAGLDRVSMGGVGDEALQSRAGRADNGEVVRGNRRQRWSWFLVFCIGLAVVGRLHPLQLAVLGVGLVAIGIGVITSSRAHGSGH
jgi:hypothetical protein